MKGLSEKDLLKVVCKVLQEAYPEVIYRIDFAAGMYMKSWGMKILHSSLQGSRAYPDIFIAEPRGKYAGLFIELKKDLSCVKKKDGTFKRDTHIEEQKEMLERLNRRGYKALFTYGYTNTIAVIEQYLKGEMD